MYMYISSPLECECTANICCAEDCKLLTSIGVNSIFWACSLLIWTFVYFRFSSGWIKFVRNIWKDHHFVTKQNYIPLDWGPLLLSLRVLTGKYIYSKPLEGSTCSKLYTTDLWSNMRMKIKNIWQYKNLINWNISKERSQYVKLGSM